LVARAARDRGRRRPAGQRAGFNGHPSTVGIAPPGHEQRHGARFNCDRSRTPTKGVGPSMQPLAGRRHLTRT
jgi:hypothetical protein